MLNIVLIGPQGSGKGTQAELISKKFQIPHISTGDLFRDAIENKTELGNEAKELINKGDLVPDELTVSLVKERLSHDDCKEGFILDGFPRDLDQAHALEDIAEITHVLEIFIPDDVSIDRISKRRICPKCKKIYGVFTVPKKEGLCDNDGEALVHRDDDKPEAIKKRLETYHDLTEPLLEYYKPRNIVHKIDGLGKIEEIFERVKKTLE